MKKILFFTIMITFLLSSQLEISTSGLKFNYKEYKTGSILDSENSSFTDLRGINIKYTKKIKKFIFNSNIEYNEGITNYTGSSWDGNSLFFTNKDVYIYNLNLIIKYNVFSSNFFILGGLGYRYWNRGISDYEGDYNEEYKWEYYLIGSDINKNINKFNIGFKCYYQKAINPNMIAYFNNKVTYNLGNTFGYRISFPIKYKLNNKYGIIFRYIYDYWKINKSDIVIINLGGREYETYEPNSKTKNQFLNVGFYYNF